MSDKMNMFEDGKVSLSLPALIDSRMLLCANSGGGKSYALRKLIEQAGGQVMSIILDYEGEFKTLREKFDFLLIGPEGDVPVSMKASPLLPRKLFELNISTIIDISDLKRHDRILYMKKFLEAVMDLPRKFWKPCLVVIDEAHCYCGQQEKQESTHAVIDLMTRGRKRGLCGILATQRISKLHKDAAAECNNYMVGRTGLDIDMKRAADILGLSSKADMLDLRDLSPGEFHVFGPALSLNGVGRVTVSKVETTHPKVGMDLKGKVTPPTAKVRKVLAQLNDLPQESEKKAATMRELQKQVRDLERQVAGRVPVPPNEKQLAAAEASGYQRAAKEIAAVTKQQREQQRKVEQVLKYVQAIKKLIGGIDTDTSTQGAIEVSAIGLRSIVQAAAPKPVRSPATPREESGSLGRCERKILSLLWNNPDRQFKKTMVGLFTGYSHKSGGFNNAVCRLNAAGLINRVGGELQVSQEGLDQGRELLGDDVDLHEQFTVDNWAQKLPKCAGLIFAFLMQNPDAEFSKEDVGEATGYSAGSGGFNNAICQLNTLGLIVRGQGTIRLNPEVLEK